MGVVPSGQTALANRTGSVSSVRFNYLAVLLKQVFDRQSDVYPKRARLRWKWLSSPVTVAGVVLLVYTFWTLAAFHGGSVATDFAFVGKPFAQKSTVSSVITFGQGFRYAYGYGYDGQFCYFIALDPENARFYVDAPAYRYTRILYPLAARFLALGQPQLIPYTLILINILAISGTTWLLASWLRRRGISPWLAVVYAFYSGVFITYSRDLTEIFAYGLVMLAIYWYDFGQRRALLSGIGFGLAALTRETTLVFAVLYVAKELLGAQGTGYAPHALLMRARQGWRSAMTILLLSAGPLLAYKVFLLSWLGSSGVPRDLYPRLIPFEGLSSLWPWRDGELVSVMVVGVPALICLAMAIWTLFQRKATVEVWALILNIVLFVLMLTPSSYRVMFASATVTTGVVLAALLSIPAFDRLPIKRTRHWLAICSPMWVGFTLVYGTFYFYALR